MKRIRILALSHMYPSTFNQIAGIFVHEQVKALVEKGVEVRVVSPVPWVSFPINRMTQKWNAYSEIPARSVWDGIKVCYPRYIRAPGAWFHAMSSYTMYESIKGSFQKILKTYRPNIIHAYAGTPDGYAGLMLARKYGLPLVCSLLGSDINVYPNYRPLGYRVTHKVISEADQLIAVSYALKSATEAITSPKHEIKVVYMGVDLEKFVENETSRANLRTKFNISSEEVVLLFVGGLLEAKGVFELIEAFAELYKQFKGLRLILVGDGPAQNGLLKRIDELNLQNKVQLVGEKPHAEIPKWLSACDIFVLPSHREGLPNVIIEAMACQRPVVATRIGGIPEAIEDGVDGLLVKPRDVDSLVEALDFLLSHPEEARAMGERARKLVLGNYTWEKNAEKTIAVYREVLSAQ